MFTPRHDLPMPEIGHPDAYYARRALGADQSGDTHAREGYKAAQYVTLALEPHLKWEEKLQYFHQALRRHCAPPPSAEGNVWLFYRQLAYLVREYAGREALRLASVEDDHFAQRLHDGIPRDEVTADARRFYIELLGPSKVRPEHFHDEDWAQLMLMRDQWA